MKKESINNIQGEGLAFSSRCFIGCAIGNMLEWYDFIIYGSLAPILSIVFFPTSDKLISITLTFTIFFVGFIARPIGGVLFGYAADKCGRQKILVLSMLITSIPALCISLLPTYALIGKAAPLLLLACRLLQGFAVGGEYPALVAYLAEISPNNNRGFLCSYVNVTTVIGVLVAGLLVSLLNCLLTKDDMFSWGWRIPFVLAFISVIIGFYLRVKLVESKSFEDLREKSKYQSKTFVNSLKQNKMKLVKIFFLIFCAGVSYYTYNVFMTSYLINQAGYTYSQALNLSLIGSISLIIFIQISGYFSDKVGRKPIIIASILGLIFLSYALFVLMNQHSFLLASISIFIFSILLSMYFGCFPAFLAEQIDTSFRCTGIGISYNLSMVLAGGTAPLVNLFLINKLNNLAAPGLYFSIAGVISLIAVIFMRELPKNIFAVTPGAHDFLR